MRSRSREEEDMRWRCFLCPRFDKGERTMRWATLLAVVPVLCTVLWAAEDKARTFRFSKKELGKVPAGWKADQTHEGRHSSIWKVVADDTAPSKKGYVLAQTA